MATTTTVSAQLIKYFANGDQTIVNLKTSGAGVSITRASGAKYPTSVTNMQELADALGSLAFSNGYSNATTSAAGLMSSSDKSKLDGIASGANKYSHPSYTAKSSGFYKVTVDSTGHVSATTAVAKSDITALGISASDHTHKYAGSSSAGGAANSVANSLAIKLNGGTTEGTNLFTFNGSGGKTVNITPSAIGAAASSHGTHVSYSTDAPKANGAAAAGSSGAVARADHVHPLQTSVSGSSGSCTGNAATATKATNDSAGQQINTTYIKGLSVSGRTITYTKGDGTTGTITTQDTDTTYSVFGKATSSAAGSNGLVPAPAKGAQGLYLRGDGTWATPTNTTYGVATTSDNGLMSSSDKSKLDGIASGANKYSHPNSGVTAGTYRSVTVNAQGHVTGGSNPTTLSGYGITDAAAKSHTHGNADITALDAGKITSGVISIDRLPQGALERCVVVADDTARFKLTSSNVQVGDTVKVTSTGKMYFVVDASKLNAEAGYEVYTAGSATSVPWSGVTGKPSTFTPSSHTHNYAGSSSAGGSATSAVKLDTSSAGSATQPVYFSGGKPVACTYTLGKSVPSNAVFTDTNTWRGIQNNLTSDSTTDSLSAAQGKVLKGLVDGKAASSHTHNYAGSSSAGGAANSVANSIAIKLNGGGTEGTNLFTFNGSSGKTVNITPSSIGAAASSHGTHVSYSSDAPKANGTASAGSSGSVARADHVHPLQTSVSGNAGTATTLQTARTIGVGTAVSSTATSFNGSANITIPITGVYESYLSWGGKNFAGSFGPIDASMIPDLDANRFAFMPAAAVEVQYSRNGGSTWSTYSTSDDSKINLFNGNGSSHYIGASSVSGVDKTNYQLRITITTDRAHVYTALNKFCIYCSTSGSTGSWCTIDGKTKANVDSGTDTWVTFANKVSISGWSGYNIINTSSITTYGNNNAQYQKLRFTFGVTSHASTVSYEGLSISRIMGFGGVGWTTPSTMASNGRMYTYDANMNVTFPAKVTATTFSGVFSGNASTATKATKDSAGQQINTTYIKGLSVSGRTITYTKGDGTTGTITTQDTNTDVNVTQSAVTASEYTNWRSLVFGSSNSGTEGFTPSTTTAGLYSASVFSCQPSTGTIKATTFKGALSGNASTATKATQDSAGQQINTTYIKGLSVSGKVITYTKGDGTTGTITTQDTNTWRPLGTTADTACAGNDSRLSNSRPASDVYAWAKASSKPSYSWSEITGKPSTFTPASHTHNYAGSSSAGGAANSANRIVVIDTRNDNPAPNSSSYAKSALSTDFKYVSKIGSPSGFGGTYCGLISFAPWSETSGGNGYQIAVGYNSNAHPRLAVRSADLSATSWGSWYKIYTSDDKPTLSELGAAAASHTHSYAGSSSAGGAANNAVKDSVGQQINTTYIKGLSVSGRTITYTKGDGTTGTITTQDTNTTYPVATQSANGLMSTADKKKVDNMADLGGLYVSSSTPSSACLWAKVIS